MPKEWLLLVHEDARGREKIFHREERKEKQVKVNGDICKMQSDFTDPREAVCSFIGFKSPSLLKLVSLDKRTGQWMRRVFS